MKWNRLLDMHAGMDRDLECVRNHKDKKKKLYCTTYFKSKVVEATGLFYGDAIVSVTFTQGRIEHPEGLTYNKTR
jgi:hypothetical protein